MRKAFFFLVILLGSCASLKYEKHPEQEFRGAWVATVVNIDWPKSSDDVVAKQKTDFLELLDFYEDLNFNALIVQVRTAGDAFYPSKLAPWSRFLSGTEGKPKPGFEDALAWMVERTHERGMQFHAWLNPYRATFDLDTTILAENHDFIKHRDWMVKYGKKYYYDPGIKGVQQHLTKVVEEVVENYAVDGIHFDDYFYPYKIAGEVFNDSLSYTQNKLPNQSLADWRRSNVDSLVKNVHEAIKTKKPWVRFGISPFGVWKNSTTDPSGSATKAGQTTYEDLFADPLLWMKHGWVDYMVPQAYWSMHYPVASHEIIARWWAKNSSNTNLYMGNGAYKIRNNADVAWNDKYEIPKQLAMARNISEIAGNVFFSAKSLVNAQDDIKKQLHKKFYRKKAMIPAMANNVDRTIAPPIVTSIERRGKTIECCISHFDSVPRFLTLYNLKREATTVNKELLKKAYISMNQANSCITLDIKQERPKKHIGIVVEDAFGNQSQMIFLTRPKRTEQTNLKPLND
ncbi:family 10 glycosylhydrolase [uncultured Croceitalea sp.]|uniref:glycoside hydrolase family 10 protein n=1 Tax=uncultured Croceitalea sp. TaxID=1798908 RepID=UPI003305644D